jgi:predicted transcriptional regulator
MARTSWLDKDQKSVRIDDYARQLGPFVAAIADGRIDQQELAAQEQRVVALIKEVEPQLDDATHERLTSLLCEVSAFNVMQTLHSLYEARPKTTFRG